MIFSMTGMGRARGRIGNQYFTVEVKSINHRFCDVSMRLPGRFQSFETDLIPRVKKKIVRGKIEVTLLEDKKSDVPLPDKKRLIQYHAFLKKMARDLHLEEKLSLNHLLAGQNYWMVKANGTPHEAGQIQKLLDRALNALMTMRKREGDHLKKQMTANLRQLELLRENVARRRQNLVQEVKNRLSQRLEKHLSDLKVDEVRLAQEVVIYADKMDVDEELERLESHHRQMLQLLNATKAVGRELDFLIQEMNREWNTMASKSQSAEISHWTVSAKAVLEKLREQVQNIE